MATQKPGIHSKKFKIVGNRVCLRAMDFKEARVVFNEIKASKKEISRWLPFGAITNAPSDTAKHLRNCAEWRRNGQQFQYGLHLKATDEFMGLIGCNKVVCGMAEIGYWLSTRHTGNGYITEATVFLIEALFKHLPIHRIEIRCEPRNRRSRAIPERLGFQEEGHLRRACPFREKFRDVIVYGILKEEWKKNRKRLFAQYG